MGLNFGSFTKVLLGIGLGILAVSCLTVTIVFGRYANSFSTFEKYENKVNFDHRSSMIDSSIAIAVLGCISAVSSIAAIVLSLLLDGQTLILIIVGGASSLFAFGCIIAEGVFTQKSYQNFLYNHYPYDYRGDLISKSNKGAQKYIKKSLEDLYNHAAEIFQEQEKDYEIPSWSDVKDKLGSNDDNTIITYNHLWSEKNDDNLKYVPIYFYYNNNDKIYARYKRYNKDGDGSIMESPVGALKYIYTGNYQDRKRYCWFNSGRTNVKCKNVKVRENFQINKPYSPTKKLNEQIVVGDYYSKQKAEEDNITVNYAINDFPISFKLIYQSYSDQVLEDSSNHYKVSGKKWAKAYFKKEHNTDSDDCKFELVNEKISNYHDYLYKKSSYQGSLDWDESRKEDFRYFTGSEIYYSDSGLISTLKKIYKDTNKGKVSPLIKKLMKKCYAQEYDTTFKYSPMDLYHIALMNLIIQIFAIIFWGLAKFIPTDEKEKSQSDQPGQNDKFDEAPQNEPDA